MPIIGHIIHNFSHLHQVVFSTHTVAIPDPAHYMYRVSRLIKDRGLHRGIIPVDWVLYSIYLLPCFRPVIPWEWSSFTVLDQCQTFYVNLFTDVYSYISFV